MIQVLKLMTAGVLALAVAGQTVQAAPVVEHQSFHKKLAEIAGQKGAFAANERFPKDYFLVVKNLPFLVGLSLHHPASSSLNLTQEQVAAIKAIKEETVPGVLEQARMIKKLELELAQNIVFEQMPPKSQYDLVDDIATRQAALTKHHLVCIAKVRAVLTDEQFNTLVGYAAAKPRQH